MGDLTPRRRSVGGMPSSNIQLRKLELQKHSLTTEKMRLDLTILELYEQIERHEGTITTFDGQIADLEAEIAALSTAQDAEVGLPD